MLFLASQSPNLFSLFFPLSVHTNWFVRLCLFFSLCFLLPFLSSCPSFNVSMTLLLIFPFSIPLTLSSSPSLLPPFLLGSLLTLLNVRAQTSPCRAAPFHREQKQLVSLPFPCFLAASVCLTVCLHPSALLSTFPFIHTVCRWLDFRLPNRTKVKLICRQEFKLWLRWNKPSGSCLN